MDSGGPPPGGDSLSFGNKPIAAGGDVLPTTQGPRLCLGPVKDVTELREPRVPRE